MTVLVDTPIWSIALRRRATDRNGHDERLYQEWLRLIRLGEAAIIGVMRQEVLSGIRDERRYEDLRSALRAVDDLRVTAVDHKAAARCYNRCRAAGITGTVGDMLICAVALRFDLPIFTTDRDFIRYSKNLPIRLHTTHGT